MRNVGVVSEVSGVNNQSETKPDNLFGDFYFERQDSKGVLQHKLSHNFDKKVPEQLNLLKQASSSPNKSNKLSNEKKR